MTVLDGHLHDERSYQQEQYAACPDCDLVLDALPAHVSFIVNADGTDDGQYCPESIEHPHKAVEVHVVFFIKVSVK